MGSEAKGKRTAKKNQAQKINFMIDHEVKKELEMLIPPGRRSRVVNEALKKELFALKRKKLTEELLQLRNKNVSLTEDEIVEEIRKYRSKDNG